MKTKAQFCIRLRGILQVERHCAIEQTQQAPTALRQTHQSWQSLLGLPIFQRRMLPICTLRSVNTRYLFQYYCIPILLDKLLNAFHAAGECRRQVKNVTKIEKNVEIMEFHDHI